MIILLCTARCIYEYIVIIFVTISSLLALVQLHTVLYWTSSQILFHLASYGLKKTGNLYYFKKLRYEKTKDNWWRIHKVWEDWEMEFSLLMATFVLLDHKWFFIRSQNNIACRDFKRLDGLAAWPRHVPNLV